MVVLDLGQMLRSMRAWTGVEQGSRGERLRLCAHFPYCRLDASHGVQKYALISRQPCSLAISAKGKTGVAEQMT
jgi:hypothetical protein